MLTPSRALCIAHDVLETLILGIESGEVEPPSRSHELYGFVSRAAIDDEDGEGRSHAVLYIAVLDDLQIAEELEFLLNKL